MEGAWQRTFPTPNGARQISGEVRRAGSTVLTTALLLFAHEKTWLQLIPRWLGAWSTAERNFFRGSEKMRQC